MAVLPAPSGAPVGASNAYTSYRFFLVGFPGCQSAAEYCDVLLTSVMKGMDVAVEEAIKASASGEFSNEVYEGTLENGGVALAPYGDNADVDSELDAKIQELKQQIIDGEIKVG